MPKQETPEGAFAAALVAADAATERARAEYMEAERNRQLRRAEAVAQFEALRDGNKGAEPLPLSETELFGLAVFRRMSPDLISDAGGVTESDAMREFLALLDRLFGIED